MDNVDGTTRGQTQLVTPADDEGFSAAPNINVQEGANPEDGEVPQQKTLNRQPDGLGAIAEDQKGEDPEASIGN